MRIRIEEKPVKILQDGLTLNGDLVLPEGISGIILFAHGSGSSRFSPRNRYVAKILQNAGFGTLLMDLLTKEEEFEDILTGRFRFDIEMLSNRLSEATKWLKKNAETWDLKIGYFGSSTGAAAALIAATKHPDDIHAIVSRGGRPDLAIKYLQKVKAPTLLIVGGNDLPIIEMNKEAMKYLLVPNRLEIVLGASHLFEESGKLGEVASLAVEWFRNYLIIC